MHNVPPPSFIISADGICLNAQSNLRQLAENKELNTIKIIIDGTQILGHKKAPSLLGKGAKFLLESQSFTLKELTPQSDGRCLARYEKTIQQQTG